MTVRGIALALVALTTLWGASACDPDRPPVCVPVTSADAALAPATQRAFPHHLLLGEQLLDAIAVLDAHPDSPWEAVDALERWSSDQPDAVRRLPDALRTVEASPAVLDDPRFVVEVRPWLAEVHVRLDERLRALADQDPDAAREAAATLTKWLGR